MAQKRLTLMADFETTTDENDCRVWAGCAVEIDTLKVVFLGKTIDEFMEYLQNRNTIIFYHNLRFDGEFLLSWLLNNGFAYEASYVTKNGEKSKVSRKERTFETLITDDGLFYSIDVIFARLPNKKLKRVIFYDSLKKLPFKVSQIAKAFELPISKGEIDYDAPRPVGYELSEEEKDYIIRDCKIVASALSKQFDEGLTRMTNASDAMYDYQSRIGFNRFEKWFPCLPLYIDEEIRWTYKGGFTYLNPKYKGCEGLHGKQYDINSLYPWTMRECVLPYGFPKFFEGEPHPNEEYPLYMIHLKCRFELKEGYIPTLQLKNNRRFVETEYLTSSRSKVGAYWEDVPVEMWLTSVDYQLFQDHYIIKDPEIINGWYFKGARGMFDEYIDHWMEIKEKATGAKRSLAKLQLNSLYGRFALSTEARKKRPYLDDEGIVRYVVEDAEIRPPVYTALSSFVTSYARDRIVRSAQANYDRFIYCDTDSLKLVGYEEPNGIDVHPTKLGAFKDEGDFENSKWIRAKTYMVTVIMYTKGNSLKDFCKAINDADSIDGIEILEECVKYRKTKVTCAGMPDNVKEDVTYENFCSGSTFEGKLMPKRCRGGIVLKDTTFTIK